MDEKDLETPIIIIAKEQRENKCHVYSVGEYTIKTAPFRQLELRQRFNLEIRYYAVLKKNTINQDTFNYILNLIEKGISSILYTYI